MTAPSDDADPRSRTPADGGPGERGPAGGWPGDRGPADGGPGDWRDDLAGAGDPAWPASPAPTPRRPGRTAAVAAALAVAVGVLGAPLGLLWAAVTPEVPVRMSDDGAVLVETQPEGFVAADGWFSLLGLGFGGLAAIGAWLVARRLRGPVPLLAVTLGAVAAGLLAWWLGRQVGVAEYERLLSEASEGAVFGRPADLRAAEAELWWGFLPVVRGTVLLPALGAAVVYTLLAGWSRYTTLRADEEPRVDRYPAEPYPVAPHPAGPGGTAAPRVEPPVSSGWTAPPDPPAAPAPPAPGAEGSSPG